MTQRPRDWRRLNVPKDAHPLVRMVFEQLNRQRRTYHWLSVAIRQRSGLVVPVDTIRDWGRHHNPRLPSLIAALDALGYAVTVQRNDQPVRMPKRRKPKPPPAPAKRREAAKPVDPWEGVRFEDVKLKGTRLDAGPQRG